MRSSSRRTPVVAENASRRRGLYSIRCSDSPVTRAAIRVNVARSVRDRLGLLGLLVAAFRPRASLVVEILVLRQQLAVLSGDGR